MNTDFNTNIIDISSFIGIGELAFDSMSTSIDDISIECLVNCSIGEYDKDCDAFGNKKSHNYKTIVIRVI